MGPRFARSEATKNQLDNAGNPARLAAMSNRVISFRVWNEKAKCWVHDTSYGGVHLFGETILLGGFMHGVSVEDLNDCVAEQDTGIDDAKGVSIWEGDIVSLYDGEQICVIQWAEEYAKFGLLICLQHDESVENDAWMWFDDAVSKAIVIGNVHEHLHLLK